MTDRPILFQGDMVRALLAGTKTQTRRVVKGEALEWLQPSMFTPEYVALPENGMCPYGQPGDRLWVRESHWWFRDEHNPATGYFPPTLTADDVEYRADGEVPGRIWRPSIHMHRWASRITLEITAARVERLQDISEADAVAEGCANSLHLPGGRFANENYAHLWWQINGDGSWESNPWVWVIEFKRVTP